jgi:hypothetical protein
MREDNIKTNFKGLGALAKGKKRVLVNMAMNIRLSYRTGNFLIAK